MKIAAFRPISRDAPAVHLPLPRPFHVEWMLRHIRTSSYGAPFRFVDRRLLRRPLRLAGFPAVAEFDLTVAGSLGIRLLSFPSQDARPRKTKAAWLEELAGQTRFLWGLDQDATGYLSAMAADPDLTPLRKRFGGLRIVRAPDMYEALLVAILGQQVSVRSAQATRYQLMANLGTQITVSAARGEERYGFYPAPQQLIAAGAGGLRALGVSRQKAAYLLGIADLAAAGELDRAAWAALSDEEALKRLVEIKGVGRWTAEIVLMRGLGRPDIFTAGDLGLQAAMQELQGLPERPAESALREIAARWTGWRSYAAFYLWMILQSRAL
ncbi:MAG: DNA-3-methyladenine glycosylase 2 family protein [Deltaproteobacteria bacterium]|nr:DNA-3-methyladenine glycosylase 2 family protein [Deltaproteobacteria bacterium]